MSIFTRVLIIIAVWRLAWWLIYSVLGVYLSYISINNGILFNYVVLNRKAHISASSVRFRLWGNSRKIIISDLCVTLRPLSSKKRAPASRPTSSDSISIFPGHAIARLAVRVALYFFRGFHVELKTTEIKHPLGVATIDTLNFRVSSTHRTDCYKFSAVTNASSLVVRLAESAKEDLHLGAVALLLSTYANCKTGALTKLATRLSVNDIEINAFNAFKILAEKSHNKPQSKPKDSKPLDQLEKLSQLYNRAFPCFSKCSVQITNLKAHGLPLFPASLDCDFLLYLNTEVPSTSLYVLTDSVSLHVSKIPTHSAGFEVLFNQLSDCPLQVTCSVLLLKIGMLDSLQRNEFFLVPNVSFTFKTNIADRLARGNGFRDSVLEMFASANSPVFDADAEQLSLLLYNYLVLKKYMALRKFQKSRAERLGVRESEDETSSEDDETTRVSDETPMATSTPDLSGEHKHKPLRIIDRALHLLEDQYPRIDVKFTIEQPRSLIRSHNKIRDKTQMLLLSYLMMVLQILTTQDQDYDSKCHFIYPSIVYSEKSTSEAAHSMFSEELCGALDVRVDCRVYKYLQFKPRITMSDMSVNLTKPDVLNGVNTIIDQITKMTESNVRLGFLYSKLRKRVSRISKQEQKLFSQNPSQKTDDSATSPISGLPSWFISLEVLCERVKIELGSVSPLTPPRVVAELSSQRDLNFDETANITIFEVASVCLKLNNQLSSRDSFDDTPTSSQASSTSETLANDSEEVDYWHVNLSVKEFRAIVQSKKSSVLLSIPAFTQHVRAVHDDANDQLISDITVDLIYGFLDRHLIFVVMGLAFLIIQTILTPIKKFRKKLSKENKDLNLKGKSGGRSTMVRFLVFNAFLKKTNLVFALSNNFKVRLQNYDLQLQFEEERVSASNRFSRVLVESSNTPGYWDRLLCVDSLHASVDPKSKENPVRLKADAIRLNQPHRFVVYKLFDNLSVFLKILKHLLKCFKEQEKDLVVSPTESKPIIPPGIRLHSDIISFTIEDDPFDSELNMIYQLGLVEQRKRLELYNLFDERCKLENLKCDAVAQGRQALHDVIGKLWIRKVKQYKARLSEEITDNQRYLYGQDTELPPSENAKVNAYTIHAPLLKVMLSGVNLHLQKPDFPLEDIPIFIHENGQGVPEDTKYNLMIPTNVKLGVREVRMHMRDYPLPLLHLPHSQDNSGYGNALTMNGNLIISENLILAKEHLRSLEIRLGETSKDSQSRSKFDKLTIEKSMSTVKLFTDMRIAFNSKEPSRFVWGQSYQFGIQQIMLTVDQFSKPPVDPSPKLGFWDKMRLIMHGNLDIQTGEEASIEVAFKGGRDPYNLFGDASGFVLNFNQKVEWKINERDDPLRFFDISAGNVSWYIPNYLSSPLVCWTRSSSKPTFLPQIRDTVNSSHGYYLIKEGTEKVTSEIKSSLENCEKKVVELSGGVSFVVGFLLQRQKKGSKELTTDCKPHYEIDLFNPDYTDENHDSYKGFRSSRIHMAISLEAHQEESYNTIHLTPGTFRQFFLWWSLFKGNTMLPVRRGKLFDELKSSEKFSDNLFTNKFLFNLKNLFISHVYRSESEDNEDDEFECVGLRAKVDEFLVDLHQQKEEVVDVHEDLERHKKVMKMSMNLGQVLLSKIDLRTVRATFNRDLYQTGGSSEPRISGKNLKVFDKDKRWFDLRDFDEAFIPSSGTNPQNAEIYPLLYSEKFAYIRDTTGNKANDSDDADTHDCRLNETDYQSAQIDIYERRLRDLKKVQQQASEDECNLYEERVSTLKAMIDDCRNEGRKSTRKHSVVSFESSPGENFHNRFLLVSMFLKWSESIRNQVLKYIHFVQMSSNHKKFMTYEFMSMLEEIIEKQDGYGDSTSLASSMSRPGPPQRLLGSYLDQKQSSEERLRNFEKIIRLVKGSEKILEDYKIEVISPQIQLHTNDIKDSVVIITAPSLESKIFSVVMERDNLFNSKMLERRYGVLLHDASVMVIEREAIKNQKMVFERRPYGTETSWPPFLGIETCKNHELALVENVLINQMSFMFTYDQVIALSSNIEQMEGQADLEDKSELGSEVDNSANRLRVDVPKLAIHSTSKQYYVLYVTVLSLLLYVEPLAAEMREKVLKLKFSIDFQDLKALHDRLTTLREHVGVTQLLLKNYSFRQNGYLDNEQLNDFIELQSRRSSLSTEIILMLQTLFAGDIMTNSHAHVIQDWRIAADEIVLHMLNDDRSPIIDLLIDKGVCKRIVKDDGSNDNRIEIKNILGQTHLKNAHFKNFLEPTGPPEHDSLITVDWSMDRAIGGIKILKNFKIGSLPLNVSIDEATGKLLMEFIFYTDDEKGLEKSPIINSSERRLDDSKENEESDQDERAETVSRVSRTNSSLSKRSKKKSSSKDSSLGLETEGIDMDRDVDSMIKRSKNYISIVKLSSQLFELRISLRLRSGVMRWLNVTNFLLVLPEWEIERRVMSFLEVIDLFKKLVIKALIQHSGSLLKNKVSTRLKNIRSASMKFTQKTKTEKRD